ncbi:hypothetical protein BT69DRAFT_1015342 [Atractiella rhizophila]|nr:hypothetical protein BT69DRAFT_1015342 [Atractiella rhizophila]
MSSSLCHLRDYLNRLIKYFLMPLVVLFLAYTQAVQFVCSLCASSVTLLSFRYMHYHRDESMHETHFVCTGTPSFFRLRTYSCLIPRMTLPSMVAKLSNINGVQSLLLDVPVALLDIISCSKSTSSCRMFIKHAIPMSCLSMHIRFTI